MENTSNTVGILTHRLRLLSMDDAPAIQRERHRRPAEIESGQPADVFRKTALITGAVSAGEGSAISWAFADSKLLSTLPSRVVSHVGTLRA